MRDRDLTNADWVESRLLARWLGRLVEGLGAILPPLRIMIIIVLVALAAALAGCGTLQLLEVKVPIPIECRAQAPARPAMPTEALPDTSGLDRFVQAAAAEIELREGYETELRAALASCITPLPRGP